MLRTALIEAVHSNDVNGTHLCGPANGYIAVRDWNDGWLPVPGESIPMVQNHSHNEMFQQFTIRPNCSFVHFIIKISAVTLL